MLTVHDEHELSAALAEVGRPLGLVPTMGAIHAGHLSLVERARGECATVVASVYVNPLQFDSASDLESYPRSLHEDLKALEKADVDIVFAPDETFAPSEAGITVPDVTEPLEGQSRPGHFDGVTTIVHKLFTTIEPDKAFFGEKDFQQLVVIRRLVEQEKIETEIVGCPTVRGDDGLALSSRNAAMTGGQRAKAVHLCAALKAVAGAWDGDADTARVRLQRRLEDADGVKLDYAEIIDPETLERLEGEIKGPARAVVAAWVGKTRLIDNIALDANP
jgi:pantoate--beta-alanine ligase